jgi:hypothetical protein
MISRDQRIEELLKRQNQLLERIAVAIEINNQPVYVPTYVPSTYPPTYPGITYPWYTTTYTVGRQQ